MTDERSVVRPRLTTRDLAESVTEPRAREKFAERVHDTLSAENGQGRHALGRLEDGLRVAELLQRGDEIRRDCRSTSRDTLVLGVQLLELQRQHCSSHRVLERLQLLLALELGLTDLGEKLLLLHVAFELPRRLLDGELDLSELDGERTLDVAEGDLVLQHRRRFLLLQNGTFDRLTTTGEIERTLLLGDGDGVLHRLVLRSHQRIGDGLVGDLD